MGSMPSFLNNPRHEVLLLEFVIILMPVLSAVEVDMAIEKLKTHSHQVLIKSQ